MRRRISLRRPSHTTVVAYLSLFLVITAGAAYGAGHLGRNSVGTKQVRNNAITTAKIKKNAVTGAKVKKQSLTGTDIDLSKLGTVPSATQAATADALAPPEAIHLVGASGEPLFLGGSTNNGPSSGVDITPVGFYKDHEGIVHLEGVAKAGEEGVVPGVIFTLPPGFRPLSGSAQLFASGTALAVTIFGSNTTLGGKNVEGDVVGEKGATVLLNGITYRPAS